MKSKVNMYKIGERQEYELINTDNTCMYFIFIYKYILHLMSNYMS